MTTAQLSPLAAAISARTRTLYEFDVSEVFKITDCKVKVRVVTKAEQDLALVGAHKYAEERTKAAPQAAKDPDILEDAKAAFIAFAACRDSADPDKFPAFLSPEWMLEHLTTDEVGYLVSLANEVRAKESPSPISISDEMMDGLSELCAQHVSDQIPEAVLAPFSREYLTHAFVMLSARNVDLRRQVVELSGDLAETLEMVGEKAPKKARK